MIYKILFASFPFGDTNAAKFRPVLALSEPMGIFQEIVLAYITSNISVNTLSSDLVVLESDESFKINGFKKSSLIRLHKLFSLPKSMIIGQLGNLSDVQIRYVKKILLNLFELER